MPTISVFFGIMIRMYYDEHGRPHFHAYYGKDAVVIGIETLEVLAGRLPRRALAMVLEWAQLHRETLLENWQRAEDHDPLISIEPLE